MNLKTNEVPTEVEQADESKPYQKPAIAWVDRIEIAQVGSTYSYCLSDTDGCSSNPKAPC